MIWLATGLAIALLCVSCIIGYVCSEAFIDRFVGCIFSWISTACAFGAGYIVARVL